METRIIESTEQFSIGDTFLNSMGNITTITDIRGYNVYFLTEKGTTYFLSKTALQSGINSNTYKNYTKAENNETKREIITDRGGKGFLYNGIAIRKRAITIESRLIGNPIKGIRLKLAIRTSKIKPQARCI